MSRYYKQSTIYNIIHLMIKYIIYYYIYISIILCSIDRATRIGRRLRRHRPVRVSRWRERDKIFRPDRTVTLTTSAH